MQQHQTEKKCSRCGAERDDLVHWGSAGYVHAAEPRTDYWACPEDTACYAEWREKFTRRPAS
jgi:hypothetical protein